MIEVKNLSVGYDGPLLQNLSLTGNAGEMVGILGRNGSGKTTLLRGMLGSIHRFSGEILIDGKDCAAMRPRQQAACLSVLPQHSDIMEGILVREVLEMGRYPYGGWFRDVGPQDREKMEQIADRLGIRNLLDADCGKLSQGQRQMVLFGRLLVQDTPVMLLDEPNASLDYDNSHTLFSVLQQRVRQEGKTAFLVLHDPELALRWCDRVLILKEGCIRAEVSSRAGEDAMTQALRQLYPSIRIRKDPADGHFRCYTEG